MDCPQQGLWVDLYDPSSTKFVRDKDFALFPEDSELRHQDVTINHFDSNFDHHHSTFYITYARYNLKKAFVGTERRPVYRGCALVFRRSTEDPKRTINVRSSDRDLAIRAVKGLASALTKPKHVHVTILDSPRLEAMVRDEMGSVTVHVMRAF